MYLPDNYRSFIHVSRYARYRDDLGRRENYSETVDRYVDFMVAHLKKENDYTPNPELVDKVRAFILEQKSLPSMRALMTAGPALERNNIAGYNCAYMPIDSLRSFDELLYILMNGTGVGYSVEKIYVSQLPTVADHFERTSTTVVVEDSKEGWAKSFREVVALLWAGQVPSWDVSSVRQSGARLRTFGGRASGPGPLEELFAFTINLLQNAAGRRITTLEAHDLVCKIASVVVVGGVRRSALISLSDLSDTRMAHAKSGQWFEEFGHRRLANNSVAYSCKPDMAAFMSEWKNLYDSKSGERGIFNREASQKQAAKFDRRPSNILYGTNPCCIDGDSWLLTTDGPRKIRDLKDKPFTAIVDGKEYPAPRGSWIAGQADTLDLRTSEGHALTLTPEHRVLTPEGWVEAQALQPGQQIVLHDQQGVSWEGRGTLDEGYLLGHLVGDGTFEKARGIAFLAVWEQDAGSDVVSDYLFDVVSRLKHRSDWQGWFDTGAGGGQRRMQCKGLTQLATAYGVHRGTKTVTDAVEEASSNFQIGFLRGLFDTDGHVEGDSKKGGVSVRLGSINRDMMLRVQRMLARLGIRSGVRDLHDEGEFAPRNGYPAYKRQKSYRLIIAGAQIQRFLERISFQNPRKVQTLQDGISGMTRGFYAKPSVAHIESLTSSPGKREVWDAEVSEVHAFDANGIYAHNSEIILKPYQFCNLTTIVVREDDTADSLREKVEIAALLGTWQSTLTNFKYLRRIWRKNTEEERLLGVSMTGQLANALLSTPGAELATLLNDLRLVAVTTNEAEAQRIGIPRSAAVTCVKPEGTSSQMVGAASGMHTWHAPYYLRTVRAASTDPLAAFMKDVGIPCEPDQMNPSDYVFSFPIKAPEGAKTRKDMSAIEHLELWLAYQRHWCEHKPSVTVSVRENEWMGVGAWVWDHFDEMSGVAFLPYSEHIYKQAPYQDITAEEYARAIADMPTDINWEELAFYEEGDQTSGSQELACSAGDCDVVDLKSAGLLV